MTFLVIVTSGNPMVDVIGKFTAYIGTLVAFLALWLLKAKKLTRQDMFVFSIFLLIILIQVLIFGPVAVAASLGFMIRLVIAMLAVRLIHGFSEFYISAMYFLALLSFVFWAPMLFGFNWIDLLPSIQLKVGDQSYYNAYDIGIHNFVLESDLSPRNAGMFWEPGAFAGYLTLALFFLIRDAGGGKLVSGQGLVLIAALLSTFSTTGYIALMVIVAYGVYDSGWLKTPVMKLTLFPMILITLAVASYFALSDVSFLGGKINLQLKLAASNSDSSNITRFGNILYDIPWIAQRPLIGWSANPETRSAVDPAVAAIISRQGNGLTGFTVRFGLLGLLAFLVCFAFSTKRMGRSHSKALFGLIIILILLNGEQFLNFSLFLTLMFVGEIAPYPTVSMGTRSIGRVSISAKQP